MVKPVQLHPRTHKSRKMRKRNSYKSPASARLLRGPSDRAATCRSAARRGGAIIRGLL